MPRFRSRAPSQKTTRPARPHPRSAASAPPAAHTSTHIPFRTAKLPPTVPRGRESPIVSIRIIPCALAHNAAALILCHNHPSGSTEPSQADRMLTERLQDALELIDVRVLDHFIVGDGEPLSMAEYGWM